MDAENRPFVVPITPNIVFSFTYKGYVFRRLKSMTTVPATNYVVDKVSTKPRLTDQAYSKSYRRTLTANDSCFMKCFQCLLTVAKVGQLPRELVK
jgi:hypothetical protein